MGNLESRFSEAGVSEMACYMETIPIIYYSSSRVPSSNYLEQSTFLNSHLPIIGPHVIAPLNKGSHYNAFSHWSNKEVLELYPDGWVKMHCDSYRASPPTYYFRMHDAPDATTYLFIPNKHTVALGDSPDVYNILNPKHKDDVVYEADFISVSLPASTCPHIPDTYRHHRFEQWKDMIGITEEMREGYLHNNPQIKSDHIDPQAIIPKLFPLSVSKNPSEKPDLKSVINVTLNKITNLDNNLVNLRHNVTAPFNIACIALSIDNESQYDHDTMKAVDDLVGDVVGAVRDGLTINILTMNIHVFHRGHFAPLDSDTGANTERITSKLEKIGFNASQIFFHYVDPKAGKDDCVKHEIMALTHYDALWPEIFKAYLSTQTLKHKYNSMVHTKKPIEPWISYVDYPGLNHLEQVRRSYLVKKHRDFLMQSRLMSKNDILYSRRTVAHALLSMGADVSRHRSKKVREWGEKIQKINKEAREAGNHPILSLPDPSMALSPFTISTPSTSHHHPSSEIIKDSEGPDEGVEMGRNGMTKSDEKLLDVTWLRQENGDGAAGVLKCLFFDPKSTDDENSLQKLIVPNVNDVHGIDLRAYPFKKAPVGFCSGEGILAKSEQNDSGNSQNVEKNEENGENGESAEKSPENHDISHLSNLHLLTETEFNFKAFISNRYLLAGRTHQGTENIDADANSRLERSFFQPLEDLSRINITWKKTFRAFNPSFETQVHTLFPSQDTIDMNIDVADYDAIIDGYNYEKKEVREKNLKNNQVIAPKTDHSTTTLYDNYSPSQLNLIASKLATPTKSTIDYLYRNDNSLFMPASIRKLKNLVLVNQSSYVKVHEEQCNGPENLRWFTPLRYLFGLHLFEYSHTCSLPFHPSWNGMMNNSIEDENEKKKIKKELKNSLVKLPLSLHDKTRGLLTIPTLRPFFPALFSQQYGPNGQNQPIIDHNDNSDDDDDNDDEDENNTAEIQGTSLLSQPWCDKAPPFEPYQIESIYHDIDEHHSNGHLGCPIHVVFVIPPQNAENHKNGQKSTQESWLKDRANRLQYSLGLGYSSTECHKLNISNITGTKVTYHEENGQNGGNQGKNDELFVKWPRVETKNHVYSRFESQLEPYNYQGIVDMLSTRYPSDSVEAMAVKRYRRQLNEACKNDLKNHVFRDKLVPHSFIEDNFHFHIIPHDHLDYLIVQIQSNAVMKRLQMYSTLMGRQ